MIVDKKSYFKNNNFRKLSKISQKDEVAALFRNRTSVRYQNWIQAWMVTMEKSGANVRNELNQNTFLINCFKLIT